MRYMVIVKANEDTEKGVLPTQEEFAELGAFNEELVKAGVMLAADGLAPPSRSKKVRFSGTERTVIDGPFAESKELVAGFWIWQVKSMEEAVEWLKRAPFDGGVEITIRPVQNLGDIGPLSPELEAKGRSLRAEVERQRKQQ